MKFVCANANLIQGVNLDTDYDYITAKAKSHVLAIETLANSFAKSKSDCVLFVWDTDDPNDLVRATEQASLENINFKEVIDDLKHYIDFSVLGDFDFRTLELDGYTISVVKYVTMNNLRESARKSIKESKEINLIDNVANKLRKITDAYVDTYRGADWISLGKDEYTIKIIYMRNELSIELYKDGDFKDGELEYASSLSDDDFSVNYIIDFIKNFIKNRNYLKNKISIKESKESVRKSIKESRIDKGAVVYAFSCMLNELGFKAIDYSNEENNEKCDDIVYMIMDLLKTMPRL